MIHKNHTISAYTYVVCRARTRKVSFDYCSFCIRANTHIKKKLKMISNLIMYNLCVRNSYVKLQGWLRIHRTCIYVCGEYLYIIFRFVEEYYNDCPWN